MPKARDLFSNAVTNVELAECHQAFYEALNKSLRTPTVPGSGRAELAQQIDDQREFLLTKSLSSAQIESVRTALADTDIGKDWTTTNPLSTGYVAYDLATPARLLAPHQTPIRNRVARSRGQGLNYQFKVISGFSGTQTGSGNGPIRHGIDESTVNTFGPGSISYARGPKINYSGYEKFVPYVQTGLSDEVSFAAQWSGVGFDDIRQQSTQALLYATFLSDERMLLGGRGTKTGFAGAIPAPTGVTLAKRTAGANEVGASGSVSNLYVYVTSVDVWGTESVPSTVATVASVTAGQVVDVSLVDAVGALGYKVYAGSTTGPTNTWAAAVANSSASIDAAPLAAGSSVPGWPITVNFNGAGTGGVPNAGAQPPSADQTAVANEFDGILTYLSGAESGYVKRLNNTFAGADGGNVAGSFENAFASLWDSVKSDPDEILFAGRDRKQLSDQLKLQSSSSYRITVDSGSEVHNAKLGAAATGLQNPITGKMVDLTVSPWLPQGNCPIVSWTLPMPDSQVGNCWEVRGPVDMTQYQWPVQEFSYSASTYQFNALIAQAPAWSGILQGVFQA